MRVDRNGSVLSLLLIRLPYVNSAGPHVEFLARLLEGRLRVTDSPGLLEDGRIGVLLPDTSPEGAWKVATDISEVYPPGPERPECDVLVYPPSHHRRTNGKPLETAENEPVGASEVVEEQSSEFFFAKAMPAWKRAIDVVGATVGLVASAPVLLAAAAAIKVSSSGPALFVQEREGRGGRRFRIWKLRTMCVDAEDRKSELLEHSQQDGPAFKMRRDPRTTLPGSVPAVDEHRRAAAILERAAGRNVARGAPTAADVRVASVPGVAATATRCESWNDLHLAGPGPGSGAIRRLGADGSAIRGA